MITHPMSELRAQFQHQLSFDDAFHSPLRPLRRSKHIPEIESLPEAQTLATYHTPHIESSTRSIPSPLNIKHDSSDAEMYESLSSPGNKDAAPQRPSTLSVPNSPLKSFEFFTDFGAYDLVVFFNKLYF